MRNLHAVSRERLHCVFIGVRFSWVLLLSDCDAFAVKRELLGFLQFRVFFVE